MKEHVEHWAFPLHGILNSALAWRKSDITNEPSLKISVDQAGVQSVQESDATE